MIDGSAPFLTKEDVQGLKQYVQGPSAASQAESTVLLHVTHSNLKARFFEIRLDRHVSRELSVIQII
jgi:tubulin-folding cofactor B